MEKYPDGGRDSKRRRVIGHAVEVIATCGLAVVSKDVGCAGV